MNFQIIVAAVIFVLVQAQEVLGLSAMTSTAERQVIIDRIEVEGDPSETGASLAETLGVTVGRFITAEQAREELSEAERRLRASGKYKDGFSIQSVRGSSYPHQVLRIRVELRDPWYYGIEGAVVRDPTSPGTTPGKREQDSYQLNAYFGSRNWLGAGLALDVETMNIAVNIRDRTDEPNVKADLNMHYLYQSIVPTILNRSFLGSNFFVGLQSGAANLKYRYSQQYNLSTKDNDQTGRFEVDSEYEANSFYFFGAGLAGYRQSKFTISGTASRTFSRNYRIRSKSETRIFIDDIQQLPTRSNFRPEDPDSYESHRQIGVRVGWSDMTGLSLIEPGVVVWASWLRNGDDLKLYQPEVITYAAYTWVMDRSGVTLGAAEKWEFREKSEYATKVVRTVQLGLRGDYIGPGEAVFFGEAFRIGSKRSELYSDEKDDGYKLNTRLNFGVRYASSSMLYSLSAGYGPGNIDAEVFNISSPYSAYERLGVQ